MQYIQPLPNAKQSVSARRVTGGIIVAIVIAVIDGEGTVLVWPSWYFPLSLPRETRNKGKINSEGPFYKCTFEIQTTRPFACCGLSCYCF